MAAALATEAASIANTLLQTTTTHSLKWTCDVCKTKQFDSFSDALEHEKSCTGHRVNAPASLAESEARIVELQLTLEQTKQSNQSI